MWTGSMLRGARCEGPHRISRSLEAVSRTRIQRLLECPSCLRARICPCRKGRIGHTALAAEVRFRLVRPPSLRPLSTSPRAPYPATSPSLLVPRTSHHESGLTLVELIVTVAIVGLLATAALPVARFQVKREKERELRRDLWEM